MMKQTGHMAGFKIFLSTASPTHAYGELGRRERNALRIASESANVDIKALDEVLEEIRQSQASLEAYRDDLAARLFTGEDLERELFDVASRLSMLSKRIDDATYAEKRRAKVNEAKSTVARSWEVECLGFSFTGDDRPRRRLATRTIKRFRGRVRQLTRRTRGVSFEQMIEELDQYLSGWSGYFGFCETPSVLRDLDSWVRRWLRAFIWKQWKHPSRRFTGLRAHGVGRDLAAQTAGSPHGTWHISRSPALSFAFPNTYFVSLGLTPLTARQRA